MHPPKIFISATTGDLRGVRQIVKEALLTINCHPVEQTNFEPDARTVENMLRGKIGDCQALIHICGMRYGAEPDVATLPPGIPRRSYTQWEYHIGRQLQEARGDDHFRVYTFICPDDFPYDGEPDAEPQEKRDLQLAHRTRLFNDPHLREKTDNPLDLKSRILSLQEHLISFAKEKAELKDEVVGVRSEMVKSRQEISRSVEEVKDGLTVFHLHGLKLAMATLVGLIFLTSLTIAGFWIQKKEGVGLRELFSKQPKALTKTLSIIAVMGEDVPYEKAILKGFENEITRQAALRGYHISISVETPGFTSVKYASPAEKDAGRIWKILMKKIEESHEQIDFFVTLGTYATQAVEQSGMLDKSKTTGLIYLGVTDPNDAKLVGIPKMAGVQYGKGPVEYGRTLDRVFKKNQRLVFLYNSGLPQDESVKDGLVTLNGIFDQEKNTQRRSPRFEFDIKPHDTLIQISDIEKPDPAQRQDAPIYFAWYGLDNILSKVENYGIIDAEKLWVVPSTYTPQNLRYAGVIVSVVDEEVGKLGAGIIIDKIDHPNLALNQIPPESPSFKVWINRSTIHNNGLEESIESNLLKDSERNPEDESIILVD